MSLRQAREGDAPFLAPLFLESSGGTWEAVLHARSTSEASLDQLAVAALCDRTSDLSVHNTVIAERDAVALGALCSYRERATAAHADSDNPIPDALTQALQPFRDLVDEDSLFIAELACEPAARGQGIGRQLVQHAITRAGTLGVARVSLRVFSDNAGALRLYERLGFSVVDSRPLVSHPAIAARGSVLRMAYRL